MEIINKSFSFIIIINSEHKKKEEKKTLQGKQ